jgi:hypothetical protein
MDKITHEQMASKDDAVNKLRMLVRRRLYYVSTIVLLIVYASAIILLVLSMSGCAVSSGHGTGA